MTFSARSTLSLIPLAIGFLLLAVVTGSGLWLSQRQQQATDRVQHSLQVEGDLNLIQSLITDAETGQRGYLLSGTASYLVPYEQAASRVPPMLDRLASEIGDNARQRVLIARLRAAARSKLGELSGTIELVKLGRAADAVTVMRGGAGQTYMRAVRQTIAQMRAEERRLLQQRSAAANRITSATRIVLSVSALLVLIVAAAAIREGFERVRRLRGANARLEAEVAARDAAEAQVRHMQRIESLGQLTGGIAHDFNNMLAIVIGSLDMARRRLSGAEDPRIIKCIDSANEGAQRAATLTTRLLAFSRQQPLEPKVLDVNRLVGSMSELLHRTIPETVSIETVLGAGTWRICADAAQLENAILNLAVNARDAMPSGGKLTIETSNGDLDERYARLHSEVTPGQYVLVSITDTGTGMPADVVERAIEPFYTTKGVGKGTGLGLSQVFGFVKQSGGHFKIYSEPGQGTTVKIYLPRHIGEDVAPGVTCVEGTGAPTGSPDTVVLVVEDEEQVRHMTADALRDLGYTVVEAADGAQALEQLSIQAKVDLLFTDVVMPNMTGKELAEKARAARPAIKVLYTTGYTRNAAVNNGAVDVGGAFIAKPFSLDTLARKVRSVLDS